MDDTRFPAQMTFNDGMARRVALKLMQIIRGSELIQEDIQNKRLYNYDNTDAFIQAYKRITETGLTNFQRTRTLALAARRNVAEHRRVFFDANVLVQIEIMQGLYGWVNALCRAAQDRRSEQDDAAYCAAVKDAAAALDQAIAGRQKALYGRFQRWYDGDRLMDLAASKHLTETLLPSGAGGDTSIAQLSQMI